MKNKLLLIWKEQNSRTRYVIGVLENNEEEYVFKYVNPELENAKKAGFDYYPGFSDLYKEYSNKGLFSNIKSRLPNPLRPDYLDILNSYGLKVNSTDMEILKTTKGRLLTDNYEFVPEFDEKDIIEFEIAGTKYYNAKELVDKLKVNDDLNFVVESDNKFDENAIKIMYKIGDFEKQLGYVPRYYTKELTKILNSDIKYSAKIRKLNFESPLDDEDITATVKLIFNI